MKGVWDLKNKKTGKFYGLRTHKTHHRWQQLQWCEATCSWTFLFGTGRKHLKDGEPQVMQPEKAIWVFRMPILGGCVVHGNGKEALQHFDWISERTHRVKSYHYSLPSVGLQPSRLGWWRHVLSLYDDYGTGKGKRSAIWVHGDMIVIQNSSVWPNVKLLWNLGVPKNDSVF